MSFSFYQKTATDTCLILEPKVGLRRKLNFRPDWTRIRIGYFTSLTSATSDNASLGNVNLDLGGSDPDQSLYVGLKDDSNILPGVAGSRYVGALPASSNPTTRYYSGGSSANGYILNGQSGNSAAISGASEGTLIRRGTHPWSGLPERTVHLMNGGNLNSTTTIGSTSGYCGHPVIREIEIVGDKISYGGFSYWPNPSGFFNPTVDTLRNLMSQVSGKDSRVEVTNPWPPGVRPDCFFLFSPHPDYRIRLHALLIVDLTEG